MDIFAGMKRQILKDRHLDNQLDRDGFVIVPFLHSEEIKILFDEYRSTHLHDQPGFYASSHMPDPQFRRRLSNTISEVFARPIREIFSDAKGLGGAFISKAPGEKGILPLHQDWNIVDENQFRSFNIWVPLVDVTQTNGAVMVLKGSHQEKGTFRGPNILPVMKDIEKDVLKFMDILPMKKGQALIYDHALWHASPVNQSDQIRLVVVYGIVSKDAELRFYYRSGNRIEEYRAHPEFYISGSPQDGPGDLEKIREFPFDQPQITRSEFLLTHRNRIGSNKISKSVINKFLNGLRWIFGSSF